MSAVGMIETIESRDGSSLVEIIVGMTLGTLSSGLGSLLGAGVDTLLVGCAVLLLDGGMISAKTGEVVG